MKEKAFEGFIDYLKENKLYDLFFSNLTWSYKQSNISSKAIFDPVEPEDYVTSLNIQYRDKIIAIYYYSKLFNDIEYLTKQKFTPELLKEIIKDRPDLLDRLYNVGLKLVEEDKKARDTIVNSANPNISYETIIKILKEVKEYNGVALENLSKNPKCQSKELEAVIEKTSKIYENSLRQLSIIYNVIMHPNCPKDKIGDYFLKYVEGIPFRRAKDYIDKLLDIIDKMYEVVNEPNCPLETLRILSRLGGPGNGSVVFFGDTRPYGAERFENIERKIGRIARRRYNENIKNKKTKFKKSAYPEKQLDISKKISQDHYQRTLDISKNISQDHYQRTLDISKNISQDHYQRTVDLEEERMRRDQELQVAKFKNANKKIVREYSRRIKVDEKELIVEVYGHKEFNPKYLSMLKSIDLSEISSKDLKVSGIDLRGTNIVIDPQLIFMRDLSNSACNAENLVTYPIFQGVNLCGSDLSNVKDLIGVSSAFVDENTKLPDTYAIMVGTYKER